MARARVDQLARDLWMQTFARIARDRTFYLNADRLGIQPPRLLSRHLIARYQRDGYAIVRGYQRVERRLADDLAIDADLPDGARIVGVTQHGLACADRAMVAKKE